MSVNKNEENIRAIFEDVLEKVLDKRLKEIEERIIGMYNRVYGLDKKLYWIDRKLSTLCVEVLLKHQKELTEPEETPKDAFLHEKNKKN